MNIISKSIYRKIDEVTPTPDKPLKYQFCFHLIRFGLKNEYTVYDEKNKKRFTISRDGSGVRADFHQNTFSIFKTDLTVYYSLPTALIDRVSVLFTGKTLWERARG